MFFRYSIHIFVLATVIKLLLIPSYKSTDFEVHRHWLALTSTLPWNQWYFDESSEWTLDYPPFFAYFEWVLSHLARFFDPDMLNIKHLNYSSPATVYFQRLTVIASDTILFLALLHFTKQWNNKNTKNESTLAMKKFITLAITFLNAGLFLVDHIHFQYNGMLFGLFVFSISFILQNNEILGATTFAVLLNFKHIFLYVAPVYFVYLFRSFCFKEITHQKLDESRLKHSSDYYQIQTKFSFVRFFTLALVVMIVFGVSFGPFLYCGQLSQLLKRLFPFKRGLVHAYWAPNVWALYIFTDKILSILFSRLSLLERTKIPLASMTRGLVGSTQEYSLLFEITPLTTLLHTLVTMLPSLYSLTVSTPRHQLKAKFIPVLVQCTLCSFMFGWHVHEKAILMVIIPLGLIAPESAFQAKSFLFLSIVGHFSLFPLLFQPTETPIKLLLWLFHSCLSYALLQGYFKETTTERTPIKFSYFEKFYLIGLLIVQLFSSIGHHIIFGEKYPFLPLLLYSTYSAVGILQFWIKYYFFLLFGSLSSSIN